MTLKLSWCFKHSKIKQTTFFPQEQTEYVQPNLHSNVSSLLSCNLKQFSLLVIGTQDKPGRTAVLGDRLALLLKKTAEVYSLLHVY
jgi:hypothetical protein